MSPAVVHPKLLSPDPELHSGTLFSRNAARMKINAIIVFIGFYTRKLLNPFSCSFAYVCVAPPGKRIPIQSGHDVTGAQPC